MPEVSEKDFETLKRYKTVEEAELRARRRWDWWQTAFAITLGAAMLGGALAEAIFRSPRLVMVGAVGLPILYWTLKLTIWRRT